MLNEMKVLIVIERIFIFDCVDTWTDINGAEWNQAVN